MKSQSIINGFGNTLITGAGPAAIQTAIQLYQGFSTKLGLYNRAGTHADRVKKELEQNQFEISLTVQGSENIQQAKVDLFNNNGKSINDEWDTLILATPCSSYTDVIDSLDVKNMKRVKTIILVSPNIGSNELIKNHLKNSKVEVLCMSTYYAATKFNSGTVISAHTKTYKKRIYIASSKKESQMLKVLQCFLNELGVHGKKMDNPVEAECRNITTYVHPPLFMNRFTLKELFDLHDSGKRFMYKLYPEGPITQQTIKTMVVLWKEISSLVKHLGAKPINLVQFLNDDNYPVPEECLSRSDIENFTNFEVTKQEYLLYVRYSSILIDPYSKPDQDGRYFEFSAVPFKKAISDQQESWKVPRIPFEDYQKLKVIYEVGQALGINMPRMKALIEDFEKECKMIENKLGMKEPLLLELEKAALNDVNAISAERGKVL